MKKILLLLILVLTLSYCNKKNEQINQIQKITIDPLIGQKHNDGLIKFINYYSNLSNKKTNISEQIDFVRQYFIIEYNADIEPIIETIRSNLKEDINSKPIASNININNFVNDAVKKFSPYFQRRVNEILTDIENAHNDTTIMQKVLNENLLNSFNDNNFELNEKEHFINMLYVYKSSIDFWYKFWDNQYNNKTISPISPNDYWKIPTADWAGGIIGCIGGPVGGLVGYLGSSVTMAIGLM